MATRTRDGALLLWGREEKHGRALVQKERSPGTRSDLRCMCLGAERDEFPFTGYII
jgi:hypothetical protein